MSDLHFRLLTLGRLALTGAEGDPAADALRRQRRKLSVLAFLALSRDAVPRATLAEMFWGEQPEERARHSLSEALSSLRKVLGPHAIAARGPEVKLAAGAPLVVDAREFAAAIRAERWAEALGLWGGGFLEGVHVGESRRLEAWIDGEQRELSQMLVRACEREHARLRGSGCWEDAAAVARRWLEAEPLSESAALGLLGDLEGADTPEADARAFREYQVLRARLEREYGAEPGGRVAARAAVLQERLQATGAADLADVPAPAAAPGLAEPVAGKPAPASPVALLPPVASTTTSSPSLHSPEPSPRGRRRRLAWWGASVVALALAAFGSWLRFAPPPISVSPARIAVLPFGVRGPAEFAYLREGVVDLLSADLDGAGPFRTVDPEAVLKAVRGGRGSQAASESSPSAREVAGRLGAGLYVSGDVVAAGGRLRISATMFRQTARDKSVAYATVEGAPDDLFRLVDRLAAELLAGSGSPVAPLGRLAALTTASLPALKQYLEGESDFRRGLYASAFESFRAAAEADTTFALADFRVAQAANWAVPPGWTWDSIAGRSRRAAAHADRLAPRARLLVQAYAAWIAGGYDEAEGDYRAVVRTWPDDVEAWTGLGEVMFHTNPMRGRPFLESGPPFERILALEPDNISALTHLLRIRLRERRPAAVDSIVARLDSLAPGRAATEYHVLHAFAQGTEADRTRALAELRASGSDELMRITAARVALYARDDAGAARIVPLLLDNALPREVQAHAHIWLAQLEVAHGRWRAAEPHLAAAAALHPAQALEQRALLVSLPFAPGGAAAAVAAESALMRWDAERAPPTRYPYVAVYNGLHGAIRDYLFGLLELRRGDTAAVARHAAALARRGGSVEQREVARGLGLSLRAHVAAGTGRADALVGFDAARLRVQEGLLESQFGSQAFERWARAELLFRLGRWQQALPWFGSMAETSMDGVIYEAPAELRQAQICERLGDRPGARAHYARFIHLWNGADPELLPLVGEARARLRALAS